MNFTEFTQYVVERQADNPSERWGQAWFNALSEVHLELANELQFQTDLDPFYYENGDERLSETIAWTQEHWSD